MHPSFEGEPDEMDRVAAWQYSGGITLALRRKVRVRCESSTKLRVVTYNYADPIFIQIIQTGFWRVLHDWTKRFDEPEVGVRPSSSFDPSTCPPKNGTFEDDRNVGGPIIWLRNPTPKRGFQSLGPEEFRGPMCMLHLRDCLFQVITIRGQEGASLNIQVPVDHAHKPPL